MLAYLYRLTIPGKPYPAPRPRFTSEGEHKAYHTKEYSGWKDGVGLLAKSMEYSKVGRGVVLPLEMPLTVHANFYGCDEEDDIDNLAKAVLDALNRIVWKDDRQIYELVAEKYPGKSGDWDEKTTLLVTGYTMSYRRMKGVPLAHS